MSTTPRQTKSPSRVFLDSAPQISLSPEARISAYPITGPINPQTFKEEVAHILTDSDDDDEKYVTDPDFSTDFVQKVDEHIKIMIMGMMVLVTLIWGIFFYYWHHLPKQLFASKPIREIFIPDYGWSGIYCLILCPWVASIYCLILVVYPDPRLWRFCFCKPRRVWRWVPYLILLAYTVIINALWLHELFFIPGKIKTAMQNSIKNSLTEVTNYFPPSWEFVHNYYQCCGMDGKTNWRNKIIPRAEIPYPFKNDGTCKVFHYGRQEASTSYNCTHGNPVGLGELWPASCCDNSSRHNSCTTLPKTTNVWTGHCYTQEIALAISTIVVVMILSITINILGAFAFFKTRILETIALRQKLKPPESHI